MHCRSDQVTGLTIIPGECGHASCRECGHAVVTAWRKLRHSLSLSIKFFLDCEKLNIDGLNSIQTVDACGSCVCVRPTACVLNSGRSPLHVLSAQMKSEIHEGIYFLARRCSLECKHPGSRMVCCFLVHLRWRISHIWQYGARRDGIASRLGQGGAPGACSDPRLSGATLGAYGSGRDYYSLSVFLPLPRTHELV